MGAGRNAYALVASAGHVVMLRCPKQGQQAQCWYAKQTRAWRPLHGLIGIVEVVGRGPGPRNHGVLIGGLLYTVPAGNLR
ncbi:MAG TPA: hypothetical protein PLX65_14760, partial [Accumulibacter sp.]|nr:hypothetical protein [Accumulibacter sp.]